MIRHHLENQEIGYFNEVGTQIGKLCYRYIREGIIDVYHTKVDEAYQGQGIAGKLYQAMIEFVQENHLKVKPSCSYVDVKMQRTHVDFMV